MSDSSQISADQVFQPGNIITISFPDKSVSWIDQHGTTRRLENYFNYVGVTSPGNQTTCFHAWMRLLATLHGISIDLYEAGIFSARIRFAKRKQTDIAS